MRLKFIFTLAVVCGLSFTDLQAQQTAKITSAGTGYLEYLPQDYNKNTNDYPIVIFLHGIGERGTTSTDPATIKTSVQKVANVGLAKSVKYGAQYPFVLISPQLKSSYGTWPANYVMEVLNHVKKYLRVNNKRIYITGLSLGSLGTWTTLGAYPDVFAAAVPICAAGSTSKACAIAAENVAIWAFHGTEDTRVSYLVTTKMVNAVNACTPKPTPLAKTTLFYGLGHNIWDKVYNETSAVNWMLSFTNGTTTDDGSGTSSNIAPVAKAGADKSTSSKSITINGSGYDADGQIVSYKWNKAIGGAVTLTNANSASVTVSGMQDGTYYFRLRVTDNDGATDYDQVKVVVSGSGTATATTTTTTTTNTTNTANIAPVANAGANRSTSSTSITLSGSGSDKDGEIVSYRWTQYSGPTATLTNSSSPNVTVSNLRDGKYYLKLTVTDDKGATDSDNMLISVSQGTASISAVETSINTTNVAPIAYAGENQRITTATSAIKILGSGSDKDGDIVFYRWTQYGGPDVTLENQESSTVTVSGLREGKYYLKLTVKDDDGAIDHDNMLLVVSES
jgi:predicted esterase